MGKLSTTDQNRRCLERARESLRAGKQASYDRASGTFLVPSRSRPGTAHKVRLSASAHGHVLLFCPCQAAERRIGFPGETPCTHGALVAVAAATLDLLVFDGERWLLTDTGRSLLAQALTA